MNGLELFNPGIRIIDEIHKRQISYLLLEDNRVIRLRHFETQNDDDYRRYTSCAADHFPDFDDDFHP
jgi:hypothetical protein